MKKLLRNDFLVITALAVIQGGLTTLSLEPFNAPLTAWLMPWPLFYLAGRFRASMPKLILSGVACAFFFCLFSFYWVMDLFANFAGLGPVASALAFVPFAVFFNLQFPAFTVLFGLSLRKRFRRYFHPRWLTAAVIALGADYAIPRLFPYTWGNFIAGNRYLVQITDLVGLYGLTPMLFGISYVLYRLARIIIRSLAVRTPSSLKILIRPMALMRLWPMPLLFALWLCYGVIRESQITALQQTLPTVRVAVINPNAPPEDAGRVNKEILDTLMFRTIPDLVAGAAGASGGKLDLVVLPESAVPFMCGEDTPAARKLSVYSPDAEVMTQLIAYNRNVDIFLNESSYRYADGGAGKRRMMIYNSSVLYSRDGRRRDTYQKRRLLAFGEYMPGEDLLRSLGLMETAQKVIGASRFNSGPASNLISYSIRKRDGALPEPQPLTRDDVRAMGPRDFEKRFPADRTFSADGYFLPLICYESLLPDHVRSFFYNPEKRDPDFIVNITQDGWYGNTNETYQHFELARVRAVETRRALVRSVNNGAAGFIDLTGRHVKPLVGPVMTCPDTVDFQVWDVPINRSMRTVYVRLGDAWIGVLFLLTAFIIIMRMVAVRRHGH